MGFYESTRGDDRFVGGGRVLSGQRLPLPGNGTSLHRRSPYPSETGSPGGASPATRHGTRRAPPAEPSTPGDPSRWDPANSRRDSPPGVIRPSRRYRRDKRFEGRDSPSSSGGSEKERIQGPDSAPGRKRAGQTQSLGAERPAATPPPP